MPTRTATYQDLPTTVCPPLPSRGHVTSPPHVHFGAHVHSACALCVCRLRVRLVPVLRSRADFARAALTRRGHRCCCSRRTTTTWTPARLVEGESSVRSVEPLSRRRRRRLLQSNSNGTKSTPPQYVSTPMCTTVTSCRTASLMLPLYNPSWRQVLPALAAAIAGVRSARGRCRPRTALRRAALVWLGCAVALG